DAVERIELYDRCVGEASERLAALLGDRASERTLWKQIRDGYARLVADLLDQELYKTFFNTLSRRSHRIRGVDPDIEFVALDIEPTDRIAQPVARYAYAASPQLERTLRSLLEDYSFSVPYRDVADCAAKLAASLAQQ